MDRMSRLAKKSADIFSEKYWTKPAGYDIIFMVGH